MTPYECFRFWVAAKVHFSDWSYDIIKYKAKLPNASVERYEDSPHQREYIRVAKHYDPQMLMLGVLTNNERSWIGDTKGDEAEELCTKRIKNRDALSHVFKEELEHLKPNLMDNYEFKKGQHPYLARLYLGDIISLETITVICGLTGWASKWWEMSDNDMILESVCKRVYKYNTFLHFDESKMAGIMKEKFSA